MKLPLIILVLVAFVSVLGSSLTSFADFTQRHPRRAQVNRRERRQNARINRGVKSGKLTQAQGDQLKSDEAAIKTQERNEVKANGGYLTKPEQKQLNKELNAESKTIRDEKHPSQ
jgi:hypothetical protein